MSQQINLFNPLFRKQGFAYTSAAALAYGFGIAAVLAAALAIYQGQSLRRVQAEAQTVQQDYQAVSARRDKLAAELAQRKPDPKLEAEIAGLDAQLKNRQDIVDTLKSGTLGNTGGFSGYMQAFSRQSVNGLWLTGFDIGGSADALSLRGRTLSADLVANYVNQLNREKILQGRQFAALRISLPPADPESVKSAADQAAKDAKGDDASKSAPPHFLEFTLSTSETLDGQKQAYAAPSMTGGAQ